MSPEHYWAGEAITALPFTESYDSHFVGSLPTVPGFEYMGPGFDQAAQAALGHGTSWGVVYTITGEGKDVVFYATSEYQGVTISLYDCSLGTTSLVASQSSPTEYLRNDSRFYTPTTAVKYHLDTGTLYRVVVESATYDSDALPVGSGFGQNITFEAFYASAVNNDLRDDALDVYVTSDGATYKSPKVLNVGYTRSTAPTDDTDAASLYATAWWKYRPLSAATITVTLYTSPEGFERVGFTVFKQTGGGSLTTLGTASNNPAQTTVAVGAGDTIFIVAGLTSPVTSYSYLQPAQYYELWLTGSKSAVQAPVPPDHDIDVPGGSDPENPGDEHPYVPIADPVVPAKDKTLTTTTLLDLIREFSAAIRRPVRIVGASTIEVADVSDPMPPGWTVAGARGYYSKTTQQVSASAKVLSLNKGNQNLSASASMVADDVKIITSGHKIVQRLPFPGLGSAPVKRVSYTFTPSGFRCDVDFNFPATPIQVRRTS